MKQTTILPFKVSKTEELISPNSGLSLYVELYRSAKIDRNVRDLFPKPGSAKGYNANVYVLSMTLLFLAGGKYMEDIRKLKLDKALRKIGRLATLPSGDAMGNWMRQDSERKIQAIHQIQKRLTKRFLKQVKKRRHTLDIDAFEIESGKYSAKYTYKKVNKGYMPIAGHLAELDWCVGYEFREGNVPPAKGNLEFLKQCFINMPKGHMIDKVRIDAAGYQADIFNWLDKKGVRFTITGAKKDNMIAEITRIPAKEWQPFQTSDGYPTDKQFAETYVAMDETDYFRIIVQRWKNPTPGLFDTPNEYCYHVICTNYSKEEKLAKDVIYFHKGRCKSENYHKEAKSGFNLSYMPCDHTQANAIWFALGLLAYNMHVFAKEHLFPDSWRQKTIQTIRWQFIKVAGKVIKHARCTWLKLAGVSDEFIQLLRQARYRCAVYGQSLP